MNLDCSQRFKKVACSYYAQLQDGTTLTNADVKWNIIRTDGTSIANGTFNEIYPGLYIMNYTLGLFDNDFYYVVANVSGKTVAQPINKYIGLFKLIGDKIIHIA